MALKTNWRQIYEACVAATTVSGTVGSWRRRTAKALSMSGGGVGLSGAGGPANAGNCHSWAGRIFAHVSSPPQTVGSFARRLTPTGGNAITGGATWPHRLLSASGLPTAT